MDYKLSPLQAKLWPSDVLDVTWCPSPQVHTYAALTRMISEACGERMVILDFGASNDLSQFSRDGSSCVA